MTLAVVGGTGFLGSSIVDYCGTIGVPVACIRAPRISATQRSTRLSAAAWRRSHGEAFDLLCRALEPFAVVVNAAGVAAPGAADHPSLFGANAVLPSVVAQAASAAGVRRLVHVSTAAVQGRIDPLDETPKLVPLSPYAASKAEGERTLLDAAIDRPREVVVYRPTSVHAAGRPVTRQLARCVASLPLVAIAGGDDRPVPVSLAENVAAGIVLAASMAVPRPVVLQPWEGITTRRLLELFGARRVVALRPAPVRAVLGLAARSVTRFPGLTARLRRLELVVQGQGVNAEVLAAAGFRPVLGSEGWEDLARRERAAVLSGGEHGGSQAEDVTRA